MEKELCLQWVHVGSEVICVGGSAVSAEELHTQSRLCDTGTPFCRTLNDTATSTNQ